MAAPVFTGCTHVGRALSGRMFFPDRPACQRSERQILHICDIEHDNEMAEASAHDKQVEDLMGAEILVSGIEERKLQCIDDTADGVNDASGYEPQEGCGGEGGYQRHHGEDTEPSHGNIDQRGKPFGTGDPEGFDQDACNGGPPYENKERDACGVPKGNHADRRIASGNQDKDHHMVDFSQKPVDFFR